MQAFNRNKWLLLASSAGVLALLVAAAVQENLLVEWRGIQAQAATPDGPLPVRLRQVVNPALGIADRCVSCHVAMAPGEESVTGASLAEHPAVVHDPSEFGCTVCHGGQGRATQRQVIAFRPAGGEDELFGLGVEQLRHAAAGILQGGFGALAVTVHRGRIAEVLAEVGLHGLQDARVKRRGGGVIEINMSALRHGRDYSLKRWPKRNGRRRLPLLIGVCVARSIVKLLDNPEPQISTELNHG